MNCGGQLNIFRASEPFECGCIACLGVDSTQSLDSELKLEVDVCGLAASKRRSSSGNSAMTAPGTLRPLTMAQRPQEAC